MDDEKISRRDVDTLSTHILIGFGVLNGAALAVSGSGGYSPTPFALGIIGAVVSQIWWYIDTALEHSFNGTLFSSPKTQLTADCISTAFIFGGAIVSAGSLVSGCLQLMGLSGFFAWLTALILCLLPMLLMFWLGLGKNLKP